MLPLSYQITIQLNVRKNTKIVQSSSILGDQTSGQDLIEYIGVHAIA